MPNKSFRTYTKSDKPMISLGLLTWLFLFVSVLILFLIQEFNSAYSDKIETVFQSVVIGLIIFFLFRLIKSQFEKQKLNGQISGNLELFTDKIEIGERTIKLSKIKTIRVQTGDYQGRREFLLSNTTVPKISNGFNNLLLIELNTGEKINVNFEQKFENQFSRNNKDFLIEYYMKEKLPFMNLLEILQISEYEEIQNFKKTIANIG